MKNLLLCLLIAFTFTIRDVRGQIRVFPDTDIVDWQWVGVINGSVANGEIPTGVMIKTEEETFIFLNCPIEVVETATSDEYRGLVVRRGQ